MIASPDYNTRPRRPLWADAETPADIEAEMVTLSALLMADEATRAKALSVIPGDAAFISEDHQILYRAIAGRHHAGLPVDAMLIRIDLSDRGELEEMGGISYLAEIMQSAPSAAHGEHYAARVAEVYRLRLLDEMGQRLRAAVRLPAHARDRSAQIIEKAQNELAGMAATGSANEIKTLGEVMADVLAALKGGGAPRITSGMDVLDEALAGGFGLGEMALIAARPSMGKSLFGKQLAGLMADKAKQPIGYINLEESNQKFGRNWLSRSAKIANHKVRRGALTRDEWAAAEDWVRYAAGVPLYACERAMTLGQVCNAITLMRARFGIKAAFVDYLQLVETKSKDRREQEVATVSKRFKNLFKRLGIAGVVIAQLNRGSESGHQIRAPRLSDLRESGQLEQDADVVLMIHRPGYYKRGTAADIDNTVQIIMAKNRDGSRTNDLTWEANLEHQEFIAPEITDPFGDTQARAARIAEAEMLEAM